MKKTFAVVLVLALAIGMMTAASAATKKISWATWAVSEESLKPTYMSMVETYMAEHPDVEIEVVSWPYMQYKDQLIISSAAGNAPDVCHIKAEWLPELLELGVLKDLTAVMSEELKADYFPNILSAVTIDGAIVDAPWFNSPYAMFYNKTLLEKAGCEVPTTWPELMAAAEKISALGADENGNKIYGYALPNAKGAVGTGYNFLPHLWVHGADLLTDGKVTLDTAEAKAAYAEAQWLYTKEISPNGLAFKDARNLFAQGVIGFYYDLEMAAKVFADTSVKGEAFYDEFGAMIIPAMDGPVGAGYFIEHAFAVIDNGKDAETMQEIGSLLEHLTGPVVLQILYDAGMGKMPDRVSVTQMDIFVNPLRELTKIFVKSLETSHALPVNNAAFMLSDEKFQDALASLALGVEADTVAASIQAEVSALYGQ